MTLFRNLVSTWMFISVFLIVTQVHGQKNKRSKEALIDQLQKVAAWYQAVPVSMSVQLSRYNQPAPPLADTMRTSVKMGYGPGQFYLKADLIEQFIDDSFQVVINHDAKMIHVYPMSRSGNNGLFSIFGQHGVTDSMIRVYKNRYEIMALPDSAGCRTLKLLSKTKISETEFRKEVITIVYNGKDSRPIYYAVAKESLVPLDEEDYRTLDEMDAIRPRLITITDKRNINYFLIRQEFVSYKIDEIARSAVAGLPNWKEKVLHAAGGMFVPAAAFGDYLVSVNE